VTSKTGLAVLPGTPAEIENEPSPETDNTKLLAVFV
jgi:hypothetical protein